MLVEQNSIRPAGSTGVDVIIRYDRAGRGFELDMALLSVFQQTYYPIHVIIVTPTLSRANLAAVREIVGAYDWKDRHVLPTIASMDIPFGADARSKLLNLGLGFLRHRFAAFLVYDDYLYSHAYKHLTQISQEDGAAVALGGINVKHVRVFDTYSYNVRTTHDAFRATNVSELIGGNFCPIHSFVVDRTKIDAAQLYFNESAMQSEGCDFLLRTVVGRKLSYRGVSKMVGVSNFKVDRSGSDREFDAERNAFNNYQHT